MPVRAFGAPHTTCTGSPAPVSTMQTRSRSAFGCCFAEITRAMVNGASGFALSSTLSTSSPIMVSLSAIVVERLVGVEMLLQPGEGEFHRRSSPPGQRRQVERAEAVVREPAHVGLEERRAGPACRISASRCGRSPCPRRSPGTRRDRARNCAARSGAPCRSRESPASPRLRRSASRPWSRRHWMSTSSDGSVNGKNDGRKRIFTCVDLEERLAEFLAGSISGGRDASPCRSPAPRPDGTSACGSGRSRLR